MLVPHLVAMAIQDLNDISCLGVSTDGSNHGLLTLFCIRIQQFHKVHGIISKLIDLHSTPNEKIRKDSNLCYVNIKKT
jgi:hypothetical protein